jgi:hypothetical protein
MRQKATGLGMAELALASVDPLGKRRAIRCGLRRRRMAQAGVVERLDAGGACRIHGLCNAQRTARHEALDPQFDVLGQPALADVLAVLVVREVESAAQPATLVAERGIAVLVGVVSGDVVPLVVRLRIRRG